MWVAPSFHGIFSLSTTRPFPLILSRSMAMAGRAWPALIQPQHLVSCAWAVGDASGGRGRLQQGQHVVRIRVGEADRALLGLDQMTGSAP